MHRLMKQKMVRGVVSQLLKLIDDTATKPSEILTVLEDLLRLSKIELLTVGVQQMREYFYMILLIIPWKSERLKVIFSNNTELTLKEKVICLLSRYIDVEFYASIDGKDDVVVIAERISKIIDCHLTDEYKIVDMFLECEHIKEKQQVSIHRQLICELFKNHFFLGIRSSQLVVTFEPFMTIYNIWHTATEDKHDRIQLAFILKTNTRPPPKTKRSFFSISKYFESDDSDDSSDNQEETASIIQNNNKKNIKPQIYFTQRYLKIKAQNMRLSMTDQDIIERHARYQRTMKKIADCLNS